LGDQNKAAFAFVVDSFQDSAWIDGGGYDLLALYIHEVGHASEDLQKEEVKGTLCPIMVENQADPMYSGWKELGVPMVFLDFDISLSNRSYGVEMSWRGTSWATLGWNRLRISASTTFPNSTDLLVHKYTPSTDSSSEADANYAVLIPP
jgi:hypothetical protein